MPSWIEFAVSAGDDDENLGLTLKLKRSGALALWELVAEAAEGGAEEPTHRQDSKRQMLLRFQDYSPVLAAVQRVASAHGVDVKRIPVPLQTWFARTKERAARQAAVVVDWTRIAPKITSALFPYQREGVERAIRRNGRLFFCDEMGLGKSLQSIAVSDYYTTPSTKQLILCPSYLRHNWKREFETWTTIDPAKIQLIMKTKNPIDPNASHVVISYDLAVRKIAELAALKWTTIVVDECHYIKSRKAKRTKALTPVLQRAEHLLMLSGTPALSRPEELFSQLHALFPRTFRRFSPFAFRFCDFKKTYFGPCCLD